MFVYFQLKFKIVRNKTHTDNFWTLSFRACMRSIRYWPLPAVILNNAFRSRGWKSWFFSFYHSIKIFHITGLLFKAEQSSHLSGVELHLGDINLLSNNSQYITVMAEDGSLPVNLSITQFSPMHNTYNFFINYLPIHLLFWYLDWCLENSFF